MAGLREWQGQTYPARWPAILGEDTHERLVRLFADPSRRAHVVGRKQHLLSGIARCGKCGGPLYPYGASTGKSATYRCVTGPAGKGCGGISVNAEILDEYVTGAVLDALESPRVQQAVHAGEDTSAPRRTEPLEEIRKAQDERAEARRDWAEDTIDKADWLDIKQRTEARIDNAPKEYEKLTGSAAVFGDIPASDMVRDAWEDWNTDRRRAAVKVAGAGSRRASRPLLNSRSAPEVPLAIRERRASSAPACRIAARSWSLIGSRAGMPRCVLVPSVRPAVRVRALRADARARFGTGRSLTVTGPRGSARASVRR